MMITGRRLFVGDLHGCLDELEALLALFQFVPGQDLLFSVGDVVGKGPQVEGLLRRLTELGARVVRGNHEELFLRAVGSSDPAAEKYRRGLGKEWKKWAEVISKWPYYVETPDIIMVHAGLQPGKPTLASMDPKILVSIRTWDGKGENLNRPNDPPWYDLVQPGKTVVFGHWAAKGVIDLPGFKGLDSGCVYGKALTGWCPEENRFYSVPARDEYSPIHYKN